MNARCVNLSGCALILLFSAVLLIGCQPIVFPAAPVPFPTATVELSAPRSADDIAEQLMGIRAPVIIDGVGPSKATDPAQAQAENEFLAVVIAKDKAFYAGDVEGHLSYYADNVISVQPGMPDIVGKVALAEGLKPYMENYRIVGTETIKRIWVYGDSATRQAEWEEVVAPKAGGPAVHHIGRCTLNWEKIDGEWKVVSEFVNYLVPPTEIQ